MQLNIDYLQINKQKIKGKYHLNLSPSCKTPWRIDTLTLLFKPFGTNMYIKAILQVITFTVDFKYLRKRSFMFE